MQLQVKRRPWPYLDTVVQDVRNLELTQEIRLSEGMPDIGRVLCAWGQPVLRGKEWRPDRVSLSGGLMLWVLYLPQEGEKPECVEGWIPFRMDWDLPGDGPDGQLQVKCLCRFADARGISPRKLMIRAGVGVKAEAFVPAEAETAEPDTVPEGLELLTKRWPLRVRTEAGETQMQLEEQLSWPEGDFVPERVVCCRAEPAVTECRIVGNKVVFRGNGNLRLICRSEDGKLRSREVPMAFSQFAELSREYGNDAQGEVTVSPTSLETEVDETGRVTLRCAMTAQYLVTDRRTVELGEDAYIPGREVQIRREELDVPVVLETRRENIPCEQSLGLEGMETVELQLLAEFPRQRRSGEELELTVPGTVQALYYGPDGSLNTASARWEGRMTLRADGETAVIAQTMPPRAHLSGSWEVPLEVKTCTRQRLPMVTEVIPGQQAAKDPERPSLILRRTGEKSLWEIARDAGTTREAIRKANGLTEEPKPEQLLLIPVP